MPRSIESYEKFNYAVRPSKQVERKLLIEAIHYLGHNLKYELRKYRYLGFGSIYFADFILLHKYLYLKDMLCIEGSDIPKRMAFNRPYRFIRIKMGRLSDVLPRLNFNRPHIVWLDYDYGLDYGPNEQLSSILDDIQAVVGRLSSGSIFIVTAEAEPRLSDRRVNERLSENEREGSLLQLLQNTCKSVLGNNITRDMLTRKQMPCLVARALRNQILHSAITVNPGDVRFFQLFNYMYADGSQMVTIGGVVDNATVGKLLRESGIYKLDFIQKQEIPIKISVPPLTTREKEAIDAQINPKTTAKSLRLKSEIKPELLRNYLKFYKHYPTYHEAIL